MNHARMSRLGVAAAAGAALFAFGMTAPAAAAPTGGANAGCGAYCPNLGNASDNGNGGGNAYGRPAAGTAGNSEPNPGNPADSKFPPGQEPDGSDNNNGYECDGNSGIAKENPAHTGCEGRGGSS